MINSIFIFNLLSGSEEDEAAFLQARLKLFIPRRPKEPFDPYGEPESTTRKFIVQGA